MKISAITAQQRDSNRVNIMVDGSYRFSLEITQLSNLGIKVGKEYTDQEIEHLLSESEFGKLYARALEYCLMRPHSSREVHDYLRRKTYARRVKSRRTGNVVERPGVSPAIAERVFDRLIQRGYIDDEKFSKYWIENRNLSKGVSRRKLRAELQAKGVGSDIIERQLRDTERLDADELRKVIAKKRNRYLDQQKFMQYLARQGFSYDDIREVLSEE